MEMRASKQGPRDEEDVEAAVSENKLTLDTLAEVLIIQGCFCRLLCMATSMRWALKLKQMVKEWYHIETL